MSETEGEPKPRSASPEIVVDTDALVGRHEASERFHLAQLALRRPTGEDVCLMVGGVSMHFFEIAPERSEDFVAHMAGERAFRHTAISAPALAEEVWRAMELFLHSTHAVHPCENCRVNGNGVTEFWAAYRWYADQGWCSPPPEGWPEGLDEAIAAKALWEATA